MACRGQGVYGGAGLRDGAAPSLCVLLWLSDKRGSYAAARNTGMLLTHMCLCYPHERVKLGERQ
jgi:hypothetical protein